MDETINILCATDNKYAPYCGVMLTSLFESNRHLHFEVFVLCDGSLSELNVRRFNSLGKKYKNEIFIKIVEASMVKGFPITDGLGITMPTYYRLLAAELLPVHIRRVIYFDCDIVVKGDILPLWELDLKGKAVAGVRDSSFRNECERLGYDSSYGYVNAGVLVCDLDYWRANQIGERFMEYIQINKDDGTKLHYMDQDTLNAVLSDNKEIVPIRYNYQMMYLTKYYSKDYSSSFMREVLENRNTPVVIHYSGGVKPWHWRYYGLPYRRDWLKACKRSKWPCAYRYAPVSKYIKFLMKLVVARKQLIKDRQSTYILELYSL